MARFDRVIPPGGEGRISLKVNMAHYHGAISKKAKVYTNDPVNRLATLTIKAFVKTPIYFYPKNVNLLARVGQKVTKTIRIKAGEELPLKLEEGYFDLAEKVTYRMEETIAGREFKILFTSIPGPAENYRGVLRLKTNYPERPEITIPIRGNIKKDRPKKPSKGDSKE